MTPAAADLAKVWRNWAEGALLKIPRLENPTAWIIEHGESLGNAERYAHDTWTQIRVALAARYRELGQ